MHSIQIDKIDKRYYERGYFIVSDGSSGQEAFIVLRDAMRNRGRVALASIVFANRSTSSRTVGEMRARHRAALRRRGSGRKPSSARVSATAARQRTWSALVLTS
jgi:hypothetical protein